MLASPALREGPWILWFILPLLIFGTVVIGVFVLPLKVVRIDDHALYVSNYRKEIRIPFSQVGDVMDVSCINIRPITIVFLTDTEFGRRIVFMPKVSLSAFFSEHPVVDELRHLAHREGTAMNERAPTSDRLA